MFPPEWGRGQLTHFLESGEEVMCLKLGRSQLMDFLEGGEEVS